MARRIGRPQRKTARILDDLLGSRVRTELLTLFVTHPKAEFYVAEIAVHTGLSKTAVRYEVRRLERLGLLVSERRGRERFYRINETFPIFDELKRIIYKTSAIGETFREAVRDLSGVRAAFLYGSVARGDEAVRSDIDLFVLGTPPRHRLAATVGATARKLNREVNLSTMEPEEWQRRAEEGDAFVRELLAGPKIYLVGDDSALQAN